MIYVSAVVVAAGQSRRFGSPKQFALLKGKSVLERSIQAFDEHPRVAEIILVLPDEKHGRKFKNAFPKISGVVKGGARRQDSVFEGFRRIDPRRADIVLVHDGARPLVTKELIQRIIEKVEARGAAVPVIPVEDTVKETAGGEILRTLERAALVRVQTPQGFSYNLLKRALEKAKRDGVFGTDEAALVEKLGAKVFTVPGDPRNIKITTPSDFIMAEALLED
jgi:2-C-methyl-D-erythritol 4-phosphate cytidylyltransferase